MRLFNMFVLSFYAFQKGNKLKENRTHRAMDDTRESCAELKYYKDSIFKPQKSKRYIAVWMKCSIIFMLEIELTNSKLEL
jgi:hypothetical protein